MFPHEQCSVDWVLIGAKLKMIPTRVLCIQCAYSVSFRFGLCGQIDGKYIITLASSLLCEEYVPLDCMLVG